MKKPVALSMLFCWALSTAFVVTTVHRSYAADGAALYGAKCAMCHGQDGKGKAMWKSKGMVDFTSPDYQKSVTDAQITDAIADGKKPAMPSFKGKISDEDIKALVAQIRSFGKK
jgi:mono/diheme cytochrome c family protein